MMEKGDLIMNTITKPQLNAFAGHLLCEEKADATVKNIATTSNALPIGWESVLSTAGRCSPIRRSWLLITRRPASTPP